MKEKKTKIKVWLIALWVVIILSFLAILFFIQNSSNVWKKIKCPTYPVDYEYEWVVKAEYKSLVLIDWVYRYTDYNELYSWCFWDAWLPVGRYVCSDWNIYNSWANKEDTWEWILDMEEDNCYYADDDISMLKTIYNEKHRED